MATERTISCHRCRHVWNYVPPLSRRDACPSCRADAKVCKNCRYYDPGSYRECRENQAEWVKEKESGNFCGWFESLSAQADRNAEANNIKGKLEGLFKSSQTPVDAPKPGASVADELARFLNAKKN